MSRGFVLVLLVLALNAVGAVGAEPRRVLLLHSFGHDFEPFTTFSEDFRSELARLSPEPLDFFDVALASARFESADEDVFVDYLRALFRGRSVDLVVPMGGPAARFAQKHRGELFAETPLLLTCVDQRHIQSSVLTDKDAVVAVRQDVRLMVEAILRLLPGTTNVAVVFGNSPLEKFWTDEWSREIKLLTNVRSESFSHLSFEQMKQRAATLPAHSVMLYGQVLVDAGGVPLSGYRTLAQLSAAANSPVFGIHDVQVGHGIIGGPLVSVRELTRQSASGAARILRGESPAGVRPPPIQTGTPTYDWRELRRWKISEDRLPPESIIKYRAPSTWERYRFAIVTGVSALVLQALLILGLVLNLRRRRKAERSLRQSEERMKLAAGAAALRMWEWDAATDQVWVAGPLAERIGPWNGNGKAPHFEDLFGTVHPDDRNKVETALKKTWNGEGDFDHVHRRVLPDGKIAWVTARGRVEFGENGKPARMLGISMDITARKLAEDTAHQVSGRLITAQEDERKRVARELHDDLNQQLAMLSIQMELFGRNLKRDDQEASHLLKELAAQVRDLSRTVHTISHQLHPSTLDHLGLVVAAESFCREVTRQSGMQVEFILDDMPKLHPEIALCLYRILQESLQNAVRHSGAAKARIELRREHDVIRMIVSDNGKGFDVGAANGGLGLVSMQERAIQVHGTLSLESAKGAGTRIEIQVPVSVQPRVASEADAEEIEMA